MYYGSGTAYGGKSVNGMAGLTGSGTSELY